MSTENEGVSVDQSNALSLAEKMATIDTASDLQERAKRGSREKLLAVLAKAPDTEPEEADRLPA